MNLTRFRIVALAALISGSAVTAYSQDKSVVSKALDVCVDFATSDDPLRDLQSNAMKCRDCDAIHWGDRIGSYSSWVQHSNRLIPVYTFGLTLDRIRDAGSPYADPERLRSLYGRVPENTYNPVATYYDQTDVYQLQRIAFDAGLTNIILIVFDGMDWQTTRAAATYLQPEAAAMRGEHPYSSGRGSGLSFLDERRAQTDMMLVCTSPYSGRAKYDVNAQTVLSVNEISEGGYDPTRGGIAPWREKTRLKYLIGEDRSMPHQVTDSAASATSLCSGAKTYNGSINVGIDGSPLVPYARELQRDQEFLVGVVTSVPVSHATPGAAYANNVTRKDYQDISRDLVGLPSSYHRTEPLSGVDVLIGGGWGEGAKSDALQGDNYATGNKYFHEDDRRKINVENGGRYVVAERTAGKSGRQVLISAAQEAADNEQRLMGFFGTQGGHLPFRTADGNYDPTFDMKGSERYRKADVTENPTLADMTDAALMVLEQAIDGFWLMIEAGDVDWANHANNLDNSVGAVASGAEAFDRVIEWIEVNRAWDRTAVIVTADHGHYLVIDKEDRVLEAGRRGQALRKQNGKTE